MGILGDIKPKSELQTQSEFDFSEEQGTGKEVYAIYGLKGSGKTTLALSFPGKIVALSFDNKTAIVKNNFYQSDNRIKVFNATKYLEESPERYLPSSEKTYNYIMALLDEITKEGKPDYILFDCAEVMTTVCEMVMRKRQNITPFGGIVNRNVWKERKILLAGIHRKALNNCNKGVIYTLYVNKDEVIVEGETVKKEDVPEWVGVVMTESDFVLRTEIHYDKQIGRKCLVRVWSSKNDKKLKTGDIIDVTDFKNRLFQSE